ncbi:MAG: hypothetical protein M3421_11195 [Bacteroidota bacterium]|nr:hypothetical protein [Bacteroidota bacterium]
MSFKSIAQDVLMPQDPTPPKKEFKAGLQGMLGLIGHYNTIAVTIGGPSLIYQFSENFSIGVGGFPSLIYSTEIQGYNNTTRTKFEPKLGLSPRIDYKKFYLMTPLYHFSNPESWKFTFGVGYKFN